MQNKVRRFINFVCCRLEQSDFNVQSIRGKMEFRVAKPALNNFIAYEWQK